MNAQPRKNRNFKRRSLRNRRANSKILSPELAPPPLHPDITYSHRFRFYCNANVVRGTISWANLSTLYGCAATTSLLMFRTQSVRLNLVEVWSVGSATPVSVIVDWPVLTSGSGNAASTSDTSITTNVPAHVRVTPPPLTDSAVWHNAADTNTAFALSCPQNSLIDVSVSYHEINDATIGATYAAVVGTPWATGSCYFMGLDGHSYLGSGATAFPSQAMGLVA